MRIPKKLLIVKDLTFILPDDFDGNLSDALMEYINYRDTNMINNKIIDSKNEINCTEAVLSMNNIRSCIQYGIVEIDNGTYKLLESSGEIESLK